MLKKVVASIVTLSFIIGFTVLPITVDAAEVKATYSGSFKKKWEKSKNSKDGAGVLTYGYNTFLIKEDYAHGYHASKNHYASISNSKGSFVSKNVKKGKTAKIEVRHNGTSITYKMVY